MKKKMEAVEVSSGPGVVHITQEVAGETWEITVSPDQIDLLIQWLAAAKLEAETKP